MFTNHPHSRFAFTPQLPVNSQIPVYGTSPPRSPPRSPIITARPRSHSHSTPIVSTHSTRPRNNRARARASSTTSRYIPAFSMSSPSSSRPQFTFTPFNAYPTTPSGSQTPRPTSPGSPPPYSLTPPELDPNSPFLAKRSASSPHLQSPPSSPGGPFQSYIPHIDNNNNNNNIFRRPSSSTHLTHRPRHPYAQTDTSDDQDTDTSPEDTIIYTSTHPTLAGTLRARFLGTPSTKCQNRDQVELDRIRPITTAPGVIGAGETETEGEDSVSIFSLSFFFDSFVFLRFGFFRCRWREGTLVRLPDPRVPGYDHPMLLRYADICACETE